MSKKVDRSDLNEMVLASGDHDIHKIEKVMEKMIQEQKYDELFKNI